MSRSVRDVHKSEKSTKQTVYLARTFGVLMPKEVDLTILNSGYACSNVLSQVRPEKWKITKNCFQSDSCK